MGNVDYLNRQILYAYWIVAGMVFAVELSYFLFDSEDHRQTLSSLAGRSLLVIAIAGLGEVLYASFRRYGRQIVVGVSLTLAYVNYLNMGLYTENAPGILLIFPMFVPLIYFDRKLLDLFGALNIGLYAAFYFAVERVFYGREIEDFLLMEFMLAASMLLGRTVLIRAIEIGRQVEHLTQSQQDLIVDKAVSQRLLKTDALTQLYNHGTFYEYLEDLVDQCRRNGLQIQVAVLDIDNFKKINDTYGHLIGDLVLKEVSIRVGMTISPNDFAARYGGEEFAIIFTEKTIEEAAEYAERIRAAVEGANYSYMGNHPVTVSAGLSGFEPDDTAETLFGKADAALYRAKRSGKNRVERFDGNRDAVKLRK
ncbi:GGDEF domain-containing protein [Saccharibacillus alkalitolerans]|uniref:GGDEF domain-containing protein n=1 Tax=Saccharibacillus alkalitolerans TaxID=2705290 RepID=A0ABX0F4K0_9BACL|nr:GGDEF domain-containing protein [Saccharibacillus alkalitolerans]NGZ75893.1 GGDEF domain-containing protein [Saccharibacillus alkalitolerans]